MTTKDRWRIVPICELEAEVRRLRSLPKIDRKLELVCSPITVIVNDINWIFIDGLSESIDFGERFAAILTAQDKPGWLLEVAKTYEEWVWEIFVNGRTLVAQGTKNNLFDAISECSEKAVEISGIVAPLTNNIPSYIEHDLLFNRGLPVGMSLHDAGSPLPDDAMPA